MATICPLFTSALKSFINGLSSLYPNLTCSKVTLPHGFSNFIESSLSEISSSSFNISNARSIAAKADCIAEDN